MPARRNRTPRRLGVIGLACAALWVAVGAGSPAGAAEPSAQTGPPFAPQVGAIFFPSVLGSGLVLGLPHICSGSVVHSPGHNLVITAAHCIYGSGVGYDFAPGYHDGKAPHGVWSASRVYVDPAWANGHDPAHDYAFLQLVPKSVRGVRTNIEDVTGSYTLGTAPAPGTAVTVSGYLLGSRDEPLHCTAPVYDTGGYPSFDCGGYGAGTSGGPWVRGSTVVGVIGGLHQGGCKDSTSYSAPFGADTIADWVRAASGSGRPDFVTPAGGDGCGSA
jgi:trypsin